MTVLSCPPPRRASSPNDKEVLKPPIYTSQTSTTTVLLYRARNRLYRSYRSSPNTQGASSTYEQDTMSEHNKNLTFLPLYDILPLCEGRASMDILSCVQGEGHVDSWLNALSSMVPIPFDDIVDTEWKPWPHVQEQVVYGPHRDAADTHSSIAGLHFDDELFCILNQQNEREETRIVIYRNEKQSKNICRDLELPLRLPLGGEFPDGNITLVKIIPILKTNEGERALENIDVVGKNVLTDEKGKVWLFKVRFEVPKVPSGTHRRLSFEFFLQGAPPVRSNTYMLQSERDTRPRKKRRWVEE